MNKKIVTTVIISIMAILFFVSCGKRRRNEGVVINGVRWATSNVDTPGTFVANPEDTGGLFTWEEAQNTCPRGWRLPTREELESLANAAGGKWTAVNGVNGRTFGTMPHQFFLPASGWRLGSGGSLNGVGEWGGYWSSSTQNDSERAWFFLGFDSSSIIVSGFWRQSRLSVRCVSE